MRQVVKFNEQLMETVKGLEQACEQMAEDLKREYQDKFRQYGEHLIIELERLNKGNPLTELKYFQEDYESFIEVGIETEAEYYPNAYIPIWKCKKELFQLIGYITTYEPMMLKQKLEHILMEMLDERVEEIENEKARE